MPFIVYPPKWFLFHRYFIPGAVPLFMGLFCLESVSFSCSHGYFLCILCSRVASFRRPSLLSSGMYSCTDPSLFSHDFSVPQHQWTSPSFYHHLLVSVSSLIAGPLLISVCLIPSTMLKCEWYSKLFVKWIHNSEIHSQTGKASLTSSMYCSK